MSVQDFLGVAAVGAVAGAVASVASTLLKDYLFPLQLERWKMRQALLKTFNKYRDPIVRSAEELYYRVSEIFEKGFQYLAQDSAGDASRRLPSGAGFKFYDAPFYVKYKRLSTVYRFCAFLGWLELYRTDARFLAPEDQALTSMLDKRMARIQAILADRKLLASADRDQWSDCVIFREEQRAIGQMMLRKAPDSDVCIAGYKHFCEEILQKESRWVSLIEDFLGGIDPNAPHDFRLIRLRALCVYLIDLLTSLAPKKTTVQLLNNRAEYLGSLREHVRETQNSGLHLYEMGDLA